MFFVCFAAIVAVIAFFSARSTRKMAIRRLEKAELALHVQGKLLSDTRAQVQELNARLGSGQIAPAPPISTPVAAPVIEAIAIPPELLPAAPSAALSIESVKLIEAPSFAVPAIAAAVAAPATESSTLEEKVALVWFTRLGALLLLVGIAFFYRYAVDNDLIGPLGRVALGVVAGLFVLIAAELIREKTKTVFLQVLLGVGLAFLFVSAYASFGFYHLVPVPAAFAAIVVITLLGGALSVRHNGEGVLVLSLLAGFLCPILLSTGQDRPGALFAYLLVMTALGFFTSARMGFRYANWLGMAGVAVLYSGWYAKYFDVSPAYEAGMRDGEKLWSTPGAYFPLASRVTPLGGAIAFLVEWLVVQQLARKSVHKEKLQPVAFLVAALLLAHVAVSALLFDHAVILGGVLAGLALLSSLLLGREERRELLGVPLVASFLALLFCAHNAGTEPNGMLAVIGLVGVIYSGGILRRETRYAVPDKLTMQLFCFVGIFIAIISGVLLLGSGAGHANTFAFVLAALSLAYAGFALSFGFAAIAAGAAAITFAGLLIAEPTPRSPANGEGAPLFLVAAAIWAAIYFAAGAWDLLKKRADPTPARLFTLSAAGLGISALVLIQSQPEAWLLRAGTLGLVGALDLVVGARLLKGGSRQAATILLGQALGLFAASAAMLFTGATVTLVWAALACVVAVLAASEGDAQWLFGAAVLFVFTLGRALFIDFELPGRQTELFLNTLGAQGVLRERLLLNTRGIALLGSSLAFLIAARSLAKRSVDLFEKAAFAAALLGHALFLTLCVTEAHNLYLTTPVPESIPLPPDSNFAFAFRAAVQAQAEALSMVTTMVMSLYAALLVGFGFAQRNKTHRFLGLGLFALALGKLVFWDVWHLARLQQMMVLIAMGALLLGSSFLYARFGNRLVKLLRDGELPIKPNATALFLLLGLGLASSSAIALEPGKFVRSRTIGGVTAPGLYRVEIDPALYGATAASLGDLRIAGPGSEEIPYFIRAITAPQRLVSHQATVVDAVTLPDGSTRAVLDLGETGLKHSEVDLQIEGSDFLRRTRIESSPDEIAYAKLAEGALVYRVNSGGSFGLGTTLHYPVSDARYLRVTLLAGADERPLPITAAHLAYTTAETAPPMRTLDEHVVAQERKPGVPESRFVIDLGQEGIPIESVRLEISTALFERHATVKSSHDQKEWEPLGADLLYRAPGAEGTSLHFYPCTSRYLRIEISDGDNPPLQIVGGHASYRPQELVFSAASAGPHTLFVGAPNIGTPTYDLAAIVARSAGSLAIAQATLGELGKNPAYQPPAVASSPPPPMSEQYKPLIVSVMALLLAGMAVWTFLLMRKR
jgi:hypothetical protein